MDDGMGLFDLGARYRREVARMSEEQLRRALLREAELRGFWETHATREVRDEFDRRAVERMRVQRG